MAEPWEDYKNGNIESGPWEDYKAEETIPQQITTSNFGKFQPSKAEIAGTALVGGGLLAKKLTTPSVIPGPFARAGAFLSGIDKEFLEEGAKIGYRNFLQKKYYDKKIPEKIANTIDTNIDALRQAARMEYDIVTEPLKDIPIRREFELLRGKTNLATKGLKRNPFKGPTKDLDMAISKGIISADVNTMGDLLELRRNLDDVIYPAQRAQGVKSQFGKSIRDQINSILHKNDILKSADEQWTNLSNILEENKKVLGETGENYLKRWSGLTAKQKESLAFLEAKIGKEPFISDLTKWSTAQKFLAKPGYSGMFGSISKVGRPILRGALRFGGMVGNVGKKLEPITKPLGKLGIVGLGALNAYDQASILKDVAESKPGMYGVNIFGQALKVDPNDPEIQKMLELLHPELQG